MKKMIVNKVRCKNCNDIIESKHIHDLVYCQCGMIAIDGGTNLSEILMGEECYRRIS